MVGATDQRWCVILSAYVCTARRQHWLGAQSQGHTTRAISLFSDIKDLPSLEAAVMS